MLNMLKICIIQELGLVVAVVLLAITIVVLVCMAPPWR